MTDFVPLIEEEWKACAEVPLMDWPVGWSRVAKSGVHLYARLREAERERDFAISQHEILHAKYVAMEWRETQLREAMQDAEGWLTQGQGSPECHYALGIVHAALAVKEEK